MPLSDEELREHILYWAHGSVHESRNDHASEIALVLASFEVGLSVAVTSPAAGRRLLSCLRSVGEGHKLRQEALVELDEITSSIVNSVV